MRFGDPAGCRFEVLDLRLGDVFEATVAIDVASEDIQGWRGCLGFPSIVMLMEDRSPKPGTRRLEKLSPASGISFWESWAKHCRRRPPLGRDG